MLTVYFAGTKELEEQVAGNMEWFIARSILPPSKNMCSDGTELRGVRQPGKARHSEIERNISKVIHINGDLFLNKNPL